jgi:flagellar biosynthesis/type III secretory pathway protein FliH
MEEEVKIGAWELAKEDFRREMFHLQADLTRLQSKEESQRNPRIEAKVAKRLQEMATFYEAAAATIDALQQAADMRARHAHQQGYNTGYREAMNQVLDSPQLSSDMRAAHRTATALKWPELLEPYDPLADRNGGTVASNPRPPIMPGNR